MTEEAVNEVLFKWVSEPLWSKPSGIMNHFTNVDALSSIVMGGKLRLTLYSRMTNGSSEGEYVMGLYHEVLDELVRGGEIQDGLRRELYYPPISFRRPIQGYELVECRPYVICFSINNDDDVMGPRYYRGKPGGWICSDANINNFSDHGLNENATFDSLGLMQLRKVCYDTDLIKKEIRRMVLEFIGTGHVDHGYIARCIGDCVSSLRLVVKEREDDGGNNASEEGEIRLIYYVPTDDTVVDRFREDLSKFDYVEDDSTRNLDYIEIPFFENVFSRGLNMTIVTHSTQVVDEIKFSGTQCNVEWNRCCKNELRKCPKSHLVITVSKKK